MTTATNRPAITANKIAITDRSSVWFRIGEAVGFWEDAGVDGFGDWLGEAVGVNVGFELELGKPLSL